MTDEAFRYDLLNTRDEVLRSLDGVVPGGTLDFSVSAAPQGSGTIDYHGPVIDWLRHRVRVSIVQDETVTPLITALVRVPDENRDATGYSAQLDLYDKTAILDDDNFGAAYALPAGTVITDAVVAVLASTGETKIIIEPSGAVLANPITWDANTPKRKIVNDLLDSANFWAIRADGRGNLRSEPYTAPGTRPVQTEYNDDGSGLYLPAFSRSYDVFTAPNRYVVIGKSDGTTEAPQAIAQVDDGRGFWLTRTDSDVEGNLSALAARRLAEARQVAETFGVTHPHNDSRPNGAVSFTHQSLGTRRAVVQKQSYRLQAGGLVTSTLRAVTA